MNRSHMLAAAVRSTLPLLTRFLDGLDGALAIAQSANLPNHAIWTLGHCAMTMDRVATRFDGLPLSADMFFETDIERGDADHFATSTVCIGSTPSTDASVYPSIGRARCIFEASGKRLAAAIELLDEAAIDSMIPWHDGEMPIWKLVTRICFHNGTHAGQLTDLRRALGLSNVIVPSV